MSRREAFRLNLGTPGTLRFGARSARCIVIDISATGARVRLTPPTLVPVRVRLTVVISEQVIELDARIRRAEPRTAIALVFDDPESAALHRLLHEAQRRSIAAGVLPTVDRRRLRRDD